MKHWHYQNPVAIHFGAGVLEDLLDLRGLVLGHPFLDVLRGTLDQILRFLQPETGKFSDNLDHLNFLVGRGRDKHNIE